MLSVSTNSLNKYIRKVRDGAPDEIDERTFHEARPVVRGTKLAANAWIHLNDFRAPHHWGCTGVFDEFTGG